ESELVSIWEEVLGREGIGVKDDFFELGGHSLKATSLMSIINKTFDIKLSLKEVFIHRTIEEQGDIIEINKWSETRIPDSKDDDNFEKKKYLF
ncbi:phosphopantetheine-binding protein, partial [Aquimarina algiphila]|uniref:phosphopantetheine-binding protein n=1 Tax=Aquimarina algiphila TaxID=2047982 RepID=UPI00232F3117